MNRKGWVILEETARLAVYLPEDLERQLRLHYDEIVTNALKKALESPLQKPYLRVNELASWIGVSDTTIRKWVRQGMPSVMIDGVVLYSKKSVTKWLDEHES